jgi:hypothetical protein
MDHYYVTGRHDGKRFFASVSPCEDKDHTGCDLATTLPTDNMRDAIDLGRELREVMTAQHQGYKVLVEGRFI